MILYLPTVVAKPTCFLQPGLAIKRALYSGSHCRERDRDRERQRQGERERQREKEIEIERDRDREREQREREKKRERENVCALPHSLGTVHLILLRLHSDRGKNWQNTLSSTRGSK